MKDLENLELMLAPDFIDCMSSGYLVGDLPNTPEKATESLLVFAFANGLFGLPVKSNDEVEELEL